MSVLTAALKELIRLGVEGEALISAMERLEAAAYEQSRFDLEQVVEIATAREEIEFLSPGARRTRAYRQRKASQTASPSVTVTSPVTRCDAPLPPEEKDPTPQKTQPSNPLPFTPLTGGVSLPQTGFAAFWAAYPSKVGRKAALAAYERAERAVGHEAILAGVGRAKLSEQWRKGFIPNPATWLNQGRWDDEPPEVATPPPKRVGFV